MKRRARAKGVASLLEQATRLVHGAGHKQGLFPAQWTALRYFAEAMPQTRTTAGLMRYQNMAMSPVARTVRGLVEKGLVTRKPNPDDGRSELIELTESGWKALESDPRNDLEALLEELPADQLSSLALALQAVIQGLLASDPSADPDAKPDTDQ